MKLFTILVLTIPTRVQFLARLLNELSPQLDDEVELLIDADASASVGAKRNRSLAKANSSYVAFVDDDDVVTKDYVECIKNALATKPDCCSLLGIFKDTNQRIPHYFFHSSANPVWEMVDGVYLRPVNHLNVVKRQLAMQAGFPETNRGEDRDYSARLQPILKGCREATISDVLYWYDWNRTYSAESINNKHKPIDPSEIEDPKVIRSHKPSATQEAFLRRLAGSRRNP